MSKEEKDLWEKNIKPENKRLWLTKLKWRFYLIGMHFTKKRRIRGIKDLTWTMDDVIPMIILMFGIMCVSMAVVVVKSIVELIWPNYFPQTQEVIQNAPYFIPAIIRRLKRKEDSP